LCGCGKVRKRAHGRQSVPPTFVLKEFDEEKNTGVFKGTIFADGTIAGQWINPTGSKSYSFQLAKRASSAWSGKWSRTESYFCPATLIIWNVSKTGFDFKLSAASGANMGGIGFFEGPQRTRFIGGAAVYQTPEGTLTFCLKDGKLTIDQQGGDLWAGLGVSFYGQYKRGEAILVPPTLVEHGVFENPAQEKVFKALAGENYETFLEAFQLVWKEDDLDHIGARVYHGGVRGLFTYMEGIIMTTPNGEMWAAVIAGDKVLYFTNSKRINGLPLTIENWRSRFTDKEVIMMN